MGGSTRADSGRLPPRPLDVGPWRISQTGNPAPLPRQAGVLELGGVMSEMSKDIKARLDAAHAEIHRICQDPRHNFRMSIPANPERDSDLIITAALTAAEGEIDRLKAMNDSLERKNQELTAELKALDALCTRNLQTMIERANKAEADLSAMRERWERGVEVWVALDDDPDGRDVHVFTIYEPTWFPETKNWESDEGGAAYLGDASDFPELTPGQSRKCRIVEDE